jgi:hypothetical protein
MVGSTQEAPILFSMYLNKTEIQTISATFLGSTNEESNLKVYFQKGQIVIAD